MIYLIFILILFQFGFLWWIFVVLHNMIQGLYEKKDELWKNFGEK